MLKLERSLGGRGEDGGEEGVGVGVGVGVNVRVGLGVDV